MSRGARIAIAIVFILAAVGFLCLPKSPGMKYEWIKWMIAAFCFIVAATCIPGRHTKITGRIIGGVVFLSYVAYVIAELVQGHFRPTWISEPSFWTALIGFFVWGLPAGYVMIHGAFPSWALIGGAHFGTDANKDAQEDRRSDHDTQNPEHRD